MSKLPAFLISFIFLPVIFGMFLVVFADWQITIPGKMDATPFLYGILAILYGELITLKK